MTILDSKKEGKRISILKDEKLTISEGEKMIILEDNKQSY